MGVLAKPQQETFALLVASGVKRADAYTSAGYSPKGADRGSARLLKNVRVSTRVTELVTECSDSIVKRLILDRNRTLSRLNQSIDRALSDSNYQAAIKGLELLGKELGMFIDRSEQLVWDGDPAKLTDGQLDTLIRKFEVLKATAEQPNARP